MSESALITDFTLGLLNKNIYESDVIKHLKKVGKSNGYKYFSFIVPSKYLKHINCDYDKKTDCFKDLDNSQHNYTEIYKNSVLVHGEKIN